MLTADLAATLGARYNYDQRLKPFTLIVDEVAEVVNERLVQILNKARGAGARLVLAAQTLVDLEARLGSAALARMVLGNVNNLIAGRLRDLETQEYITESLVKTRIRLLTPAQSATSGVTHLLAFSNGYQMTSPHWPPPGPIPRRCWPRTPFLTRFSAARNCCFP